jgi:hypothetical protein
MNKSNLNDVRLATFDIGDLISNEFIVINNEKIYDYEILLDIDEFDDDEIEIFQNAFKVGFIDFQGYTLNFSQEELDELDLYNIKKSGRVYKLVDINKYATSEKDFTIKHQYRTNILETGLSDTGNGIKVPADYIDKLDDTKPMEDIEIINNFLNENI